MCDTDDDEDDDDDDADVDAFSAQNGGKGKCNTLNYILSET